ncbi:MAG: hypothetical protein LLG02_15840 [Pelosinus sp.]|nr:hypothetical protein [Pelosinus sp.]
MVLNIDKRYKECYYNFIIFNALIRLLKAKETMYGFFGFFYCSNELGGFIMLIRHAGDYTWEAVPVLAYKEEN